MMYLKNAMFMNKPPRIYRKQKAAGWGSSTIEKLAKDLQSAFPGIEGFSRTNVFRMRAFYETYKFVPQAVGQI
jgi:hypothetical protein